MGKHRVGRQRKLLILAAVVVCVTIPVVLVAVGYGREGTPADAPEEPATGSAGYRDASFDATNVEDPTANKSQSKLWFNDGAWWGSLFDRSTGNYRIHRYNWDTRTWADTGTDIDERNSSKADTLWDGTHLYVVSAGPDSSVGAQGARLLRYSYDAATKEYSLDQGFPVDVTGGGTESIVLAKDTAGELWVTYTEGGRVYVAHTRGGDDLSWAEPFVLPVRGTTVDEDDISAIVAFDSQVGVMWSNQADGAFHFATHRDGDAADEWRADAPLQGDTDQLRAEFRLQEPNIADDHINLKADSEGRVFAAVKTSFDEPESAPESPVILLLERSRDGGWTPHVFGRKEDIHKRPVVLIDEENRGLYVVATAPCCGNARLPRGRGGEIFYKRASLDDISFEEGRGTPLIQSSADADVNDATSTKQGLDGETGLVVLASDKSSGRYLHNALNLD